MRNIKLLLVVGALLLVAGCAARSQVVPAQQGNVVTFTHEKSGKAVTVSVAETYRFKRVVDREFKGVPVYGYLYSNGESGILVSRMTKEDFEELARVGINASESGVKAYPPRTIYQPTYCELIRAYVVSFEGEVVAAIKAEPLEADNAGCGNWLTLDDVMAEDPDRVTEFDQSADEAIFMKWD